MPAGTVTALADVCLEIAAGEVVAIVGPSGSGKSTLLHLVGGLDRPTTGRISVFGQDIVSLSESKLTRFRANTLGYVFQESYLLPGLTALENVVAGRLPWGRRSDLVTEALALLKAVGLGERTDHAPDRLSGGERQRVSLARALLGRPSLLVADEPTGDLDTDTTEGLLSLLLSLRSEFGLTLLLATHDTAVASVADRKVRLGSGRVVSDQVVGDAPVFPSRVLD